MNISTLLWGRFSMEHLKASLDGVLEHKASRAMAFGSALHCRLLEPDQFSERFEVAAGCQGVLKSGKRAGEECGQSASYRTEFGGKVGYYCSRHAPKTAVEAEGILSKEDAEHIEAINHKVRQHPVVKLIRQHGGFEASLVFDKDGVRCKARLDKWIVDADCPDTIVDLKKTRYCEAAAAVSGTAPAFIWLAVEESPPYGINVLHCDMETLRVGQYLNETLFAGYVHAKDTGDWSGYAKDIHPGGLPAYRLREFQGLI